MWLPDWFYKVLPFICSIAGIAIVNYGQNLGVREAGALLILTAIFIWLIPKEQNK
jgi:hypothetical protein